MLDFLYFFEKLLLVFPILVVGFGIAFFLTPWIKILAFNVGALDMPSFKRRRTDPTLDQRLHKVVVPRLGGLVIVLTFLVLMFIFGEFNSLTIGLGLGLLILTFGGFIDDVWEISGKCQFLFQLFAVLCIVIAGVRIDSIGILGVGLDFSLYSFEFGILDYLFSFVFPADIITIFWFLVIMNAMNWVGGIDFLEEAMGLVAGFTIMLLAIKFGNDSILLLASIFTSAVLGFSVFNFPPAKIYNGNIGDIAIGYFLGIFAIELDGKMTTSILLLALPIVDFVWVLFYRVIKFKELNPLNLMTISGRHHLHHRLLDLGMSKNQVLFAELSIFSIFAVFAYYLAGFNILFIALILVFSVCCLFFAYIQYRKSQVEKIAMNAAIIESKKGGKKKVVKKQEIRKDPESVYAY